MVLWNKDKGALDGQREAWWVAKTEGKGNSENKGSVHDQQLHNNRQPRNSGNNMRVRVRKRVMVQPVKHKLLPSSHMGVNSLWVIRHKHTHIYDSYQRSDWPVQLSDRGAGRDVCVRWGCMCVREYQGVCLQNSLHLPCDVGDQYLCPSSQFRLGQWGKRRWR